MSDLIDMSRARALIKDFEGHIFDSPYVQRIFKLVCCRDTSTKEYRDSLTSLLKTPTSLRDIQLSILYLEVADGNATEASKEKELDFLVRLGPAFKNGKQVNNHSANPIADRSLAKTGTEYNPELCEIKLNVNGKEEKFTYAYADTIKPDVAADINALNRWRYIILRSNLGVSAAKDSTRPNLHQLQIDYVFNRYAELPVDLSGFADFEEVKNDYNAVFANQYFPGRFEPCREKTTNAIRDLITRKAIDPPDELRKWPTTYSPIQKFEAAKGRIRKEWKDRCKANGMSVTEEKEVDIKALEAIIISDDSEDGGVEVDAGADEEDAE